MKFCILAFSEYLEEEYNKILLFICSEAFENGLVEKELKRF